MLHRLRMLRLLPHLLQRQRLPPLHLPLHLHRLLRQRQPRRLLRGVPGIELRELVEAEICCGSAGTYNLLHPEPAAELGQRKAQAVLATGADLMVTANPGCWMQVATSLSAMGRRMPVTHTVQVLDASIRGVTAEQLLATSLDGPGTVTR